MRKDVLISIQAVMMMFLRREEQHIIVANAITLVASEDVRGLYFSRRSIALQNRIDLISFKFSDGELSCLSCGNPANRVDTAAPSPWLVSLLVLLVLASMGGDAS